MQPAGRRNCYVTIEQPVKDTDEAGQLIATWTTYVSRWAAIEPLSGRETFAAKQANATTTHRITLLDTSGVTPQMRVLYNGRVFSIDSVRRIDERRSQGVELTVTEAV